MSAEDRADLAVVGGGPAGSTLASLVKLYAPERRVVLLEKERGPRHHIGESLLPGLVPVLKELGVFERVDAAGFPRKIGANYVWGESREPWENDFNEVNVSQMLKRGALPERIEYAWQVRRSVYDEILLARAAELGVEVVRGAAAEGVMEEDGRITGLRWRGADGAARATRAALTADCSGQGGFISRFRPVRRYDRRLRNVAGYAYFQGARWKYEYSGHPDKTKIFICSTGAGWFWYIPIDRGAVSVGLVTSVDRLKELGGDLRALFDRELAACEELRPLLENARRIEDFDGSGKSFFTQQDWSYLNVSAAGPGWLAAGDAAVFVDPILSSGVTLAHLAAHRAAYTALSAWEADADAPRAELLWADYDRWCRESAAQFLALALFWYGNDRRTESWWGRAREVQRALLPVDLGDHGAFIAVSAGLTRHYERLLAAEDLHDEAPLEPADLPFLVSVLGAPAAAPPPGPGDRPRLLCPWTAEFAFHPQLGRGRLRAVKRARFLKHPDADAAADALNPRRAVTPWHLALLEALDGRRTLEEALRAAGERGAPAWWLQRSAPVFLRELELQGVLDWSRAPVGETR